MLKRIRSACRAFLSPAAITASLPFPPEGAEPSPLTRDVINQLKDVKGFFNLDDCMHFYLLLQMQTMNGVRGDILEIGTYFGRSTMLLAYALKTDERLVVCDAFADSIKDQYSDVPTVEDVRKSIRRARKDFPFESLIVHSCLSTNLVLDPNSRFRFIHVDGGHTADVAYSDLVFTSRHLADRGIIAIDDYKHPNWPGVTEATDRFLSEQGHGLTVLADMNRHNAKGRKLYLIKAATSD